ncbi:hypothetical protein COW36_08000 [bacterium (Candidatus Blackallbacteria) CG17_big_fil_post_rev_8_21_14_2_50_48_46]|uniref:Uncharacterized protein n=1 Tax=bacterium (Candidatus Blackallbacteria) CG17_big_fil_post_rev_8_21_14_2_50_48_46 TaxID=2014261 RepID=A0A2M7G5Z0_9BACT|nr:MAG: hypothetical protein COW64_24540 [bacterium (Candidatus Blackallbacteria) CG18_big_fil_WC_8_21_14_2_50_49_26]PIW17431.1 MAG: hypothetical protein COW36_08000 [bacterium (Candidatus Blackallbacteria) CG17_big_fil_post_rev_8_21_14_2_50_48_46]PIW48285.1 MAG: hypothetical protein COW20_09355 [bacterium (Candidatus Blackallbacteria) CG13_big_fil_rev_8_21_14_2_50_49_14]
MSERDSFIQPFKTRLFEIFNASSSGQDPYRQAMYQRQQRRKKNGQDGEQESWEQESQNFFDDFISLDEEKITHGLSQAQARKAFDRKFRTSSHRDEIARELELLQDTLATEGISPEVTAQKLEWVTQFLADFNHLVKTRLPALTGKFDLFSLPVLKRLKEWGFQTRTLQNLVWFRCMYYLQQEVLDNPEAYLHVQLTLNYLDIPQRHTELQRFIERHLIDLESCRALIHQTLHYLEQNMRLFEAFVNELHLLSVQAQPYYLKAIGRPYLNLEKRLGRKHLENRYLRLRAQLFEVQRQIRHLDKTQSSLSHFLSEKAELLHEWSGMEASLCSLLSLTAPNPLNPEAENFEQTLYRLGIPAAQEKSIQFSLEDLVQILEQAEQERIAGQDTPSEVFISPLTQRQLQSIKEQDLATLEKWALYKSQQILLFQKGAIRALLQACQESRQLLP